MLLDEVAAHLDNSKKDALLSKIKAMHLQAWLTTTTLFEFLSIRETAQFFEVKDNTVREIILG